MNEQKCFIFDLDGTLVDSEPWSNQAFLNLLPQIDESLESFIQTYRGWRFSRVLEHIEQRFGKVLPTNFETHYRNEVASLFQHNLQAIPGAAPMLEQLKYPKCIASNGPMAKMQLSLQLTGLNAFFDNALISAYDVGSWKPDPGLFLHAAKTMSATPSDCVVIEDSEVGLAAAKSAGMQAVHYCPNGESSNELWIKHLSELPALAASL